MKRKNTYYVVWVGKVPGVYDSWEECKLQIDGYPNSIYKSFPSLEQAQLAYSQNSKDYLGKDVFKKEVSDSLRLSVGMPIQDSICVDGAWNTQSGAIEYQGVYTKNKLVIFHQGPFELGTNNIAEFLGIVHALGYCKLQNLSLPIYSDSKTAISWIERKKANTKIIKDAKSVKILSLISRAESWLSKNSYENPILKWETLIWGENPADFGRK